LHTHPDLEQRHREEWPELWDRIDAVVANITHTP
jgi:hypothetical protein